MSTQTILGHSFPTPCKRCGGALYRQVDYCPYCGAVHPLDAGPHKRVAEGRRVGPHYLARDPRDPTGHLCSRSSREGHQQDAPGVGAVDNKVRNPVGQRVGLARASAGDDEEGLSYSAVMPHAMFNGTALLRIEFIKIGHSCQHESPRHRISDSGTKDNEQNRRRARRLVVGHLATSSSSA